MPYTNINFRWHIDYQTVNSTVFRRKYKKIFSGPWDRQRFNGKGPNCISHKRKQNDKLDFVKQKSYTSEECCKRIKEVRHE